MCNSGQLGGEFHFCMEIPHIKIIKNEGFIRKSLQTIVVDQMLAVSDTYVLNIRKKWHLLM